MLSEKELKFLQDWELKRVKESSFVSKLTRGLPMAFMFGLPMLFSIAFVYFFSPEWYTKISQRAAGSSGMILISVFLFILFFSYFRMHFKWEMNEQLYEELKSRQKKAKAAND
ncbi:MAG: hypothetical protein H7258_08495 [Ferruginibacter sp.]|nr:hypothetical protein [Ferruginibacter sp.]